MTPGIVAWWQRYLAQCWAVEAEVEQARQKRQQRTPRGGGWLEAT